MNLEERFDRVMARIHAAETAAGRPKGSVQLIAVSKFQPASAIREAYQWGQRHFGENYLQEAIAKQDALRDLDDIVWHFIGPVQSNKTRPIAERFDWVHSLSHTKTILRLNEQRPQDLPPLNVCVQVNVSRESTKSGVEIEDLDHFIEVFSTLDRVRLRGLMAIPAPLASDEADPAKPFRDLRHVKDVLSVPLDTLSMGMSDDLEWAILEGATWVRIGTAVFGPRQASARIGISE